MKHLSFLFSHLIFPIGRRQCLAVSLTGAVSSKKVTEERKGKLIPDGNRNVSVYAKAGLTARVTTRADAKAGVSDPPSRRDFGWGLTDKSYFGDNRLVTPESSYRRRRSAPRCRLTASWSCSRFQGLGCSPIKAVRELGSERRETVRTLSGADDWIFEGSHPQYERTWMRRSLVYQLSQKGTAG